MNDGDVVPVASGGLELEPDDRDAADGDEAPGTEELPAEEEDLPRLRWLPGRRWAGAPERRSKALPVLLAIALALGVVAGVVARGFVSPSQIAARSSAPQPSLITARVRYAVLPAIISMRSNVANGTPVAINAPSDLGSSIAVVTSVGVHQGQRIGQGQLLFTVDQRPVFAFAGVIPTWRAMVPGMHGPDVKQLQAGLAAAGFGTGSDPVGRYGAGTAAAVAALYRAHGLTPVRSGAAPKPTTSG